VIPCLERARQIAVGVEGDAAGVSAPPDYDNWSAYEGNSRALAVLRVQVADKERIARILGPVGPQLSSTSFHPTIWEAASSLFDTGHYRQAVQTAGQALESYLQTFGGAALSGAKLGELFGVPNSNAPRLHFGVLDPSGQTYTSAREGGGYLIRGAMLGVRNLVSHPEWPDPSEVEALEMLAVLSYVAHYVDRAELMP
jgi:hypothetical protein